MLPIFSAILCFRNLVGKKLLGSLLSTPNSLNVSCLKASAPGSFIDPGGIVNLFVEKKIIDELKREKGVESNKRLGILSC